MRTALVARRGNRPLPWTGGTLGSTTLWLRTHMSFSQMAFSSTTRYAPAITTTLC
jgi:hypothetical protein